jgi:hypothetical protein
MDDHDGQVLPYHYEFKDKNDVGPFTDNDATKLIFRNMQEISLNYTFYSYLKTADPDDKEKMSMWILN